jgi:EF hand
MNRDWKKVSALAGALVLGAGMGFAGAAAAADYGTTPPANQATQPGKTTAPSEQAQPGKTTAPSEQATQPGKTTMAAPSKAEAADAAFKKLDASGKGYVSMDDAKAVPGFEKSFQANDADHDGKLTLAEFKKAWQEFTGNKS